MSVVKVKVKFSEREEPRLIPSSEDGTLSLKKLQEIKENAAGLLYYKNGICYLVPGDRDVLRPLKGNWGDVTYHCYIMADQQGNENDAQVELEIDKKDEKLLNPCERFYRHINKKRFCGAPIFCWMYLIVTICIIAEVYWIVEKKKEEQKLLERLNYLKNMLSNSTTTNPKTLNETSLFD